MRLNLSCNETQSHSRLSLVTTPSAMAAVLQARRPGQAQLSRQPSSASPSSWRAVPPAPRRAVTKSGRDQRGRRGERVRQRAEPDRRASTSQVSSILNNPNTDPHTYEASTSVAQEVSKAAAHRPERRRLRRLHEQHRVGLTELESQGHRGPARPWAPGQHAESPPLVQPEDDAGRGQGDGHGPLGLDPSHRAYFQARLQSFDASLKPWLRPSPPSRRSTLEPRWPPPSRWPTISSPPWA